MNDKVNTIINLIKENSNYLLSNYLNFSLSKEEIYDIIHNTDGLDQTSYFCKLLIIRQNLSEEILSFMNNKYSLFKLIIAHQKVSEKFIINHIDYIKDNYCIFDQKRIWSFISENQSLSESFIEKYSDFLDWNFISYYQKLSEDFMLKFKYKINWIEACYGQVLSEKFIKENINLIDFKAISVSQKLSDKFIDDFSHSLFWNDLCQFQNLSEYLITKYMEKINFRIISIFQKLSEDFIKKYNKKLSLKEIPLCYFSFIIKPSWQTFI